VLRPYQDNDLDGMAEMFADAEVTAHTLLGRRNREQTLEILNQYVSYFEEHSYGMRAVTLAATGSYLGECGVFDSPTGDGRLYLRYALARQAWGNGYAVEAADAVIKDVFSNLDCRWIMAGVTPDNVGSLRVMEKLHFQPRQKVTVHGVNYQLFELERNTWQRVSE
jgi:RimJ/RimL family protein N-acetyltransferase